MKKKDIAVIGAGIVGVTAALEAQKRGHTVYLIDQHSPGQETSFGNAGVLSDASILIMNNPSLFKKLLSLMGKSNLSLQYNFRFVLKNFLWLTRFLAHATEQHMYNSARSLRELLVLSVEKHKSLLADAGAENLLNKPGWLRLFRSESAFQSCQKEFELLKGLGVSLRTLDAKDIKEWEPCLAPLYQKAVMFEGALSVCTPHDLVKTYIQQFEKAGGQFLKQKVIGLEPPTTSEKATKFWSIKSADSPPLTVSHVVIAAGPWSADIADHLGYTIPMAWERGYHLHLAPSENGPLQRPIHDYEGGFVIAPSTEGVRVLTGVEINHRDAPSNHTQIEGAVLAARKIGHFGEALDAQPWRGARPVLPDSMPMIGSAPRHEGLWFNFAHQHIGMSASTGSAILLCDLMEGKTPPLSAFPFRPERFRL